MIVYKIPQGPIDTRAVINEMIEQATTGHDTVTVVFRGIPITVQSDTDADVAEAEYWQRDGEHIQQLRDSPKGRHAAAVAEQGRRRMQAEIEALMAQLPDLDFADPAAAMDWLGGIVDSHGIRGVTVPAESIITAFQQRGFEPDANMGDSFNADDEDNFARFIIGLGLSFLKEGAGRPGMFCEYVRAWREKFR